MKLFNNMFMSPYMDAETDVGSGAVSEETGNEVKKEETAEKPKIKVKVLHEEKEIPIDEAAPWIQKGMDYDRIRDGYDKLKSNPAISYAEKIAKANNITIENLVEIWQKNDEKFAIEALAEKENMSTEAAERLYRTEKKQNLLESEVNSIKQTKAEEKKQEAEFKEFFENYPEIKPDAIPKEVWNYKAKTGKSLNDCMVWHENKSLKTKLTELEKGNKVKEANKDNSFTSTGNVANNETNDTALTEEMVEKMSPQELSKRWSEVKKLFKMK